MEALLTGWIVYLTTIYITNRYNRRQKIDSNVFYLLILISLSILETILSTYKPEITLYPLIILSLIVYFFKIKKNMLIILMVYYLFLFLTISYFPNYKNFVIPASFLPFLIFYLKDFVGVFYGFIVLEILISFFNPNLSLGILLVFFSFIKIVKYLNKVEEEKETFKLNLAKMLNDELKQEYEKLEFKLQIAYKKLKELFKLSGYTVKEISLNDMAGKIVEGLVGLGYTGSFIYLNKDKIKKKEGFFPNYKIYIDNVQISAVSVFENNKTVIIPLINENENIGMIGIYSSTNLVPEEIEFLMTYANTISTSIAKTNFLLEKIKLRDLVQKTIESIDIGIIVLNQQFNVELINRTAKDLLKKETETGNLFEVFDIFKGLENDLRSVIHSRKRFESKLTVLENPKKVWEIKASSIFGRDNNIENIILIIEDITQKEEIENQILQSEKLAVIGRLVAGISHEIRNPLAIINQSAYSLKRKIVKLLNENTKDFIDLIERIERNVSRANDIVERLLNFSKPYYSKVEPVNIKYIIEEAINLASLQVKKSDITFSKKLKDVYIKGDRNSLIQLFVNLFINAIESIKEHGNISVKIYKNRKENKVIIKIKDNGVGIPSNYIDKIFEPFFTTKEKGTGLGLFVSYRIVESHNGKIYVDSEEGKGTQFTIEFPIYQEGSDG
uniref:histidine kinase n=1 Tax=uncultured Aquificaceae bacterium TaxID=374108 RepID=A0A146JAX2_9AQUI|nr:putative integral membrane sensor signal transduction histidine kinase [uncultured Aquificaceae bacterium]